MRTALDQRIGNDGRKEHQGKKDTHVGHRITFQTLDTFVVSGSTRYFRTFSDIDPTSAQNRHNRDIIKVDVSLKETTKRNGRYEKAPTVSKKLVRPGNRQINRT